MQRNFEKWVSKVGKTFPVMERQLSEDGKFVIVQGPSDSQRVRVPVEKAIEKTTGFVGAIGEQAVFIDGLGQAK